MDAKPILIPLLNPNEPEALLAAVHVSDGQHVEPDQPLCTLETTKSTAEVTAEAAGYVRGLSMQAGQTARAGEVLCYLAGSPDWQPPAPPQPQAGAAQAGPTLKDLRISQPALDMAQRLGMDLTQFPAEVFITEAWVQRRLAQPAQAGYALPEASFDPTAILVYGGGGHGKALIDLLRSMGIYRLVGVVDDGLPAGSLLMGLPVIGGADSLAGLYQQGVRLAVNAVGGIGNVAIRIKVFQTLASAGFTCPALVHPSAWVETSSSLAPGVQVFPHAYVGSEAQVSYGAIVNTGAIVSHDCRVGPYANLSPGAILAGEVSVGAGVLVGMGATINLRVSIGAGARIGNGATVKTDVPENGIVRAGTLWPPG